MCSRFEKTVERKKCLNMCWNDSDLVIICTRYFVLNDICSEDGSKDIATSNAFHNPPIWSTNPFSTASRPVHTLPCATYHMILYHIHLTYPIHNYYLFHSFYRHGSTGCCFTNEGFISLLC